MSDGLNQVRAMRIAEIMGDFRNLMNYISSVRFSPRPDEANEEGFVLLRQCLSAAQALLAQPFQAQGASTGNSEQDKAILKRIITDAAVRRFQAQKLYLRVTSGLRWVNGRSAVLQGGPPGPQHRQVLDRMNQSLRQELASVNDQRVFNSLRQQDTQGGKWMAEDPSQQDVSRLAAASGANRG